MKKVLFIANHAGFSKFNAPYFEYFRQRGWQVDNASPGLETGTVDNQYDVDIARSPFSFKNLKALKRLKELCRNNDYDLIHCHTPVGGVLGRLCTPSKSKTKVMYTCHGFHFFRGSSLLSWILFFPIEYFLSFRTDSMVLINQEDYDLAKKRFPTRIHRIDGVGVNLKRFRPSDNSEKIQLRRNLNLSEESYIVIYVAQFIPRKNHRWLVECIPAIRNYIPGFKLLLVGDGPLRSKVEEQVANSGLQDVVQFLGYRKDVEQLYRLSDLLVSVSLQEGFPINIVEGMASGLPVVFSRIRGHVDIASQTEYVRLYSLNDRSGFIQSIKSAFESRDSVKPQLISEDSRKFSVENSIRQMSEIYQEAVPDNEC